MASTTDQLEMLVKIVVGIIIFCSIALILPFRKTTLLANQFMANQTNEGFSDVGYPTSQLCTMPLTTPQPKEYGPAESTIKSPKEPYHLLGDYIKPAQERIANFTSECAYIADGERLIEKTGTYGQVTNNYKRKKPDNGTTLLHELSVSFYE
jgi:hypothetical protein